ncbi:hypothetical protein Tco_0121142 [Tanacetum coccineum]
MEHPFEQPSPEHQPSSPRQESDIPQTQAPTHTHEAETGHMSVDDLFQLVPQLMTRIESLEKDLKQTKQTMGHANSEGWLKKESKKMEKVVKSRRVVLTDSEDEAAENSSKQGRNLQKDESEVFETPKQGKSSGETDISPQGLEAAETLAEALNVSTGFEDVSTGFKDVSTGFTDINSASEKVSSVSATCCVVQREGKAKRYLKRLLDKRTENISEKSIDELAAKRLQEELELSEAQKKRMAQVQEAAQFYTEEDWDTIRAKLEANADLVKEIAVRDYGNWLSMRSLKENLSVFDEKHGNVLCPYWITKKESKKRIGVELQKEFLHFQEAKKSWQEIRIAEEAVSTKSALRRMLKPTRWKEVDKPLSEGVFNECNSKGPAPAKIGLNLAKSGTEEDVEAYMEERVDEPSSEEFPMSSIPQGQAPAKIVKWQIIKTGKRGVDVLKYGDNRPEEEF